MPFAFFTAAVVKPWKWSADIGKPWPCQGFFETLFQRKLFFYIIFISVQKTLHNNTYDKDMRST